MRADRLQEYGLAAAGFLLLAEGAGWKISLAFFLITCASNVRARRLTERQ